MIFVVHLQLSDGSVQSRQSFGEVQDQIVAFCKQLVVDVPAEGNAVHEFACLVVEFEVLHRISSLRGSLVLDGRDGPSHADREWQCSFQAIEIRGVQIRRRTCARWIRWRFASNDGGALIRH